MLLAELCLMSEPTCIHSYAKRCVVCEAIGMRSREQSLSGCRCVYDLWNEFLSSKGCPVHDQKHASGNLP